MLHTMKRGLFVGSAVAVVAALLVAPRSAACGHGHATVRVHGNGPRASCSAASGGRPMFGGPGLRGPRLRWVRASAAPRSVAPACAVTARAAPGCTVAPAAALLASGNVLKTSATLPRHAARRPSRPTLKGGKTLAEVPAGTNGKTAAGLIAALTNEAKDNLDAAVAAGWITQSRPIARARGRHRGQIYRPVSQQRASPVLA